MSSEAPPIPADPATTAVPQGPADRRSAGMALLTYRISPRGPESGPTNTTFPKVVRVFGREGTTDALAD